MSAETYNGLKKEYYDVTKKVIKATLTKNKKLHEQYKIELITTFNAYQNYTKHYYEVSDALTKKALYKQLIGLRERLVIAFEYLKSSITLSENYFEPISNEQLESIKEKLEEITEEGSDTDTDEDTEEEREKERRRLIEGKETKTEEEKMEQRRELIKMANGTINRNYGGDPLGLEAFINSIKLIRTMAEEDQAPLILTFVKTKLEGKALEAVDSTVDTIDELITQLRAKIKPDNSKVIAGKMMALRMQRHNPQTFAKDAEDLADALQRSLVIEGISFAKANEMTIDKTIEMCRASAKSDVVRSILGAAQFADPKEVVAKMLIETTTDNTEKQVLAFERYNNKRYNYRSQNGNDRRPWRNGRGRNTRGSDGRGNNFGRNGRNNGYHNTNSRGGYRGNNSRGHTHNNGNDGNGHYNNNGGGFNVRRTENMDGNPVVNMGNATNNTQNNQRNF